MAKKYYRTSIPIAGAKIGYAVDAKSIEYAVALARKDLNVGDHNLRYGNAPIYLSDYTPWRNVKTWWYEDENYNYGKELE